MTWFTDGSGTRWVDDPQPKKRRASPRALRFAELAVGDQLMHEHSGFAIGTNRVRQVFYYVVTDLWFDPVRGQRDPVAGEMVAIRMLNRNTGEPHGGKHAHTRRGLASQGFQKSDIDFAALAEARRAAMAEGSVVVGIALGRVIRQRPKISGSRL